MDVTRHTPDPPRAERPKDRRLMRLGQGAVFLCLATKSESSVALLGTTNESHGLYPETKQHPLTPPYGPSTGTLSAGDACP